MHLDQTEFNWHGIVEGDEKTFEHVYLSFHDALYNYGKRYTSDTELIEDAIQDLFLRIWKNRKNLRQPPSLKNYLYKGFRNHLSDKLKAGNRYVLNKPEEGPEFEFILSAEHIIINNEQKEQLSKRLAVAIATLTARQREAIFLRFYEEFSYQEVATILDLSVKDTYKLMGRAIDALRQVMGSQIVGILIVQALNKMYDILKVS
ncbi:RNA polymerase sigma factor, sigma-70 family [bacterium A37T11]|nr:RNA polymerase sigma factor, sigma-70 family [bacterium A37T11]